MRVKRICAVALVILLSFPFISFQAADASGTDLLRLSEVMPHGQSEGFSLCNYGVNDVDLCGYRIEDGEGYIEFTSSLLLTAGTSITILKDNPEKWLQDRNVHIRGQNGIGTNNFQLNDDGDELTLIDRSGNVLDTFAYGICTPPEGWKGDTFPDIKTNHIAKRTSSFDTDSAADWTSTVPGRTSFSDRSFQGHAVPIVFPDSEESEVMDALAEADSEVLISMYILDHDDIASILLALLNKAVTVRILIEGSPTGGTPETELGIMSALVEAGAEIDVMKNVDGFRRYSYLHNKYAIIDSETVIVTSENWRYSSFTMNRGWGAVVHSQEYGGYMRSVFNEDSDASYGDVVPFEELYPAVIPSIIRPSIPKDIEFETFPVTIRPVVGPDRTYRTMMSLISDASDRLYSQQLETDIGWMHGNTPLTAMAEAYKRGVDSRLIIDTTFDSPYDSEMNDGYWIKKHVQDLMVMTSDESRFDGMMHNKGVIADDSVWIGSMNWNDTSFKENREVGVIIQSAVVSDMFASCFLSDWGSYDGSVSLNVDVRISDGCVIVDASSSSVPSGAVIQWDLDGDGVFERTGTKIVAELPSGTRRCVLSVDGGNETHTLEFTIDVPERKEHPDNFVYIPVVVICVMIIAYRLIRGRGE